jgi:nucleotide-binding universal stress UspA family protein
MMRNILVALDASDHAGLVLEGAIDLARGEGARLHLLHVVPVPPSLPPGLLAGGPATVTEYFEDAGRELLKKHASAVPAEVLASTGVRMGTAWREICAVAKEKSVDLIVLGAHEHGAVGRMLGTTAAKVVNHADRSIFVVRSKGGG